MWGRACHRSLLAAGKDACHPQPFVDNFVRRPAERLPGNESARLVAAQSPSGYSCYAGNRPGIVGDIHRQDVPVGGSYIRLFCFPALSTGANAFWTAPTESLQHQEHLAVLAR